jgi:hypothetical protein
VKIFAQISIALGAVVIAALAYLSWPEIRHMLRFSAPQEITAVVRLTNRCPLSDTSFVLRHVNTGRSIPFSNSMARIQVVEGDYLELQLAARYTAEVTFNGFRQRAAPNMSMTADCGMSERIQGTMESMRDKFGD